jgi:transcriptional regulator of acetoin/glycerol metabolism
MSDWEAFVALVAAEVGQDAAGRIAERARQEIGGSRLVIPKRTTISDEQLQAAVRKTGWRRDLAAKRLGISRSTFYRRMVR